jgi:glucose-6-phosphate 1-dehydrogenase
MISSDIDFILFGGTSDLAMRKIFPALYTRDLAGNLTDHAKIICIARRPLSQEELLNTVEQHVKNHIRPKLFQQHTWNQFCQRIHYVSMDAEHHADYTQLTRLLRPSESIARIFYLATPPQLFIPICQHLHHTQLIHAKTRVVLEKPLGHNLQSAQAINQAVGKIFNESQIFRIDHYLGKETVQNLLALRFGNILFEPLWRREWISDIQITLAEEIGVGNRIAYYNGTGALRDMVQNHLLQLLCIVAMEPPTSISANDIRDEKLQVLHALKPFTTNTIKHHIVRGQYTHGHIHHTPVPSYKEETLLFPECHTETFVALKTEIDSWRWAGVPFYLRTGKRLPAHTSEIVVRFKSIPHSIFKQPSERFQANFLIIRLQPDEGLSLALMAKTPGIGMHLKPVELALDFADTFKTPGVEAYERLLLDIFQNNLTLFMRADELEAAWNWIEPILNHWQQHPTPPEPYAAGTWGPASAQTLITRDGFQWHENINFHL